MMDKDYKRIAVKVGSNVLTRSDGSLDITRMSALVDQMVELRKQGMEVILVSSGAVASGRSELQRVALRKLDSVDRRQLFRQWDRQNSSTVITSCSATMDCRWGRC